jgi:hypothetical protein
MRRLRGWTRLAVTIAAALVAGCARAPTPPEREPFADAPPQTVSREELRRRIDAGLPAVTSLRGKLDLAVRATADGRYRTCRGALAAGNPWSGRGSPGLYLQGYRRPMPAFFTLVSDGRQFWLHVPRENVVYTGPVARRRVAVGMRDLRLDARDLFRALFVQPVAALDQVTVEEEPASYVLSVFREGRPLRRIWVDRRGLVARREVFLDAAGRVELAIERERYREVDGRLYPGTIVLTDTVTGGAVRLEFGSLTLDPAGLTAEAFRPRTPPDARVERVPGEGDET